MSQEVHDDRGERWGGSRAQSRGALTLNGWTEKIERNQAVIEK